ncbi:hypothetical protein ASE40_17025 [Flavobacterium sp. Root935]|uniref:hypothetical protein n=1 Tax=Flavobacterium sp. Root935 TaxID=1736610 RepID=UPI00070F5571|nr:hypothetical protein [Flavobacterium sp. Root935]KRD58043.1 hypothetical protein ASE40_17025 [Flavobacterium sp. Root935]
MESKLSIAEFRTRLKDNTEIGSPKELLGQSRIFPLSGPIKPFYGFFDDRSFSLTVNSAKSSAVFLVKGNYENINNRLQINYNVEPVSTLQYAWVKYAPIVLILAINIFFLFFAKGLRRASTIVNLFLLFMAFYSRWKEERKRKKLEEKFIRIFEIK